jgi:O-methyltransferase
MSAMGNLLRLLVRYSYSFPAVTSYYRRRSAKDCPASVLILLGVAHPSYRTDFYTLSRIVEQMSTKGGLIAECGVYRGATLFGMAHKLRAMGKSSCQLVGFDSFEGFPEPTEKDALADGSFHARAIKGVFADTSYEELSKRVRALGLEGQITLVKGYFENSLSAWSDESFSVVHLDCDLYSSYITCLEFFYPRVKPGGYIVFDEYDFSAPVYPGAQKAIDSFLADKPEKIQHFSESRNPRYFIIKQ